MTALADFTRNALTALFWLAVVIGLWVWLAVLPGIGGLWLAGALR